MHPQYSVRRDLEQKTASRVAWRRCKSARCKRAWLWFAPGLTTLFIGLLKCHTASNTAPALVCLRAAEDLHDAGQQLAGASAHVHGLEGEAQRVDADHRNSRIQAEARGVDLAGLITRR